MGGVNPKGLGLESDIIYHPLPKRSLSVSPDVRLLPNHTKNPGGGYLKMWGRGLDICMLVASHGSS